MPDDPTALVEGASLLTAVYGHWPSFHDAEVVRVLLDRSAPDGPTLEIQVHVFEMTDRVGPTGHYVLENHMLVTLLFSGVELERMDHFNHQNALWDLKLTAIEPDDRDGRRIAVDMPGSYGLESAFECTSCRVVDVRPFEPAP